MKFQLTCFVDETLIGTLTELIAPYSRVIVKLAEGEAAPSPIDHKRPLIPATVSRVTLPQTKRRMASVFAPNKGMGSIVALRAVQQEMSVQAIKQTLNQHGLASNGSGATLSKLKRNGYIRRLDKGVWRITPKGEHALQRLAGLKIDKVEEAVEHESVNS